MANLSMGAAGVGSSPKVHHPAPRHSSHNDLTHDDLLRMSGDSLTDPQSVDFRSEIAMPRIERYTVLLKDGKTHATIYPVTNATQVPVGLLMFLCDEFNMEIERGQTTPLYETLDLATFQSYWFGATSGVMLLGDSPQIQDRRHWEKECLGTFYVKPNYPGRSSHVCTAEFLVNAGIRGKGIGRTMLECFQEWAPKLGYTMSVFNLIYETNMAARRICETMDFKKAARLPGAGLLKNIDTPVDAYIYTKELVHELEEDVSSDARFNKIKYFLETGQYPPGSNRSDKSRLRSSSSNYHLHEGKLMLKDREVISSAAQQLKIAQEFHSTEHSGVNKTTTKIAEKYHWTRIKATVAIAIRNCEHCADFSRTLKRQKTDLNTAAATAPTMSASDIDTNLLSAGLKFTDEGIISVDNDTPRLQRSFSQYRDSFQSQEDIPVDPQVESAFEQHVQGGEEISIARALIQANESNEQPKFF